MKYEIAGIKFYLFCFVSFWVCAGRCGELSWWREWSVRVSRGRARERVQWWWWGVQRRRWKYAL